MALSGKSPNAFLFRNAENSHRNKFWKMFIMPQTHRPLYTLSEVLYISNHLFLHENVERPSYDPGLLFKLPSSSRNASQTSVQAAWWNEKQVESWISRLEQESSSRLLHFSGLLIPSPRLPRSFVASSTVWRVMRNVEPLSSHGTLFSLPWGTSAHLLLLSQLSRHLSPPRGWETLQKRDHILVTENLTMAAVSLVLENTWTDWSLFNLRFSSHLLFLNLWCLAYKHVWFSTLYF